MKVSSKTQYALNTVLDLALHHNTGVVRVADISRRQGIPQKFLEQILMVLKSGGIVGSKRGAKGGYFLLRPAAEITLASVVRLTEETLLSDEAAGNANDRNTPYEKVWQDINAYVTRHLEGLTVQMMCEQASAMSRVLEFSI
ncbi:MAG: Rrf2 family transcriptional regulator [Lentisphaerae bacterium]|nr:Rrf2 family transcriptional regulator [Lentisphaerota bacterium]